MEFETLDAEEIKIVLRGESVAARRELAESSEEDVREKVETKKSSLPQLIKPTEKPSPA